MCIKRQIFCLLLVQGIISFGSICLAQSLPAKSDILAKMVLVDNHWIDSITTTGNNDWARAAYNVGNMAMYYTNNDQKYLNYANLWATNNNWAITPTAWPANDQCSGQTYIELYKLDTIPQPYKIASITTNINASVNSSQITDWYWCDALFMAMPTFAKLGSLYNNTSYFDKMYALYSDSKTRRTLYDTTAHLWYRDSDYLYPRYKTPSGKKCFWSRGDGWVFAAHARTLQVLPTSDPHYNEYLTTFKDMAAALKDVQRPSGFWYVSLYDTTNYPGPESSGTCFFTYGFAWGINNGFLDEATYKPVVAKAWNGLVSIAVHSNGFLGYVQAVAHQPSDGQPVTTNSTTDYGVGAFLLAGSEVYKLADTTGIGQISETPPTEYTLNQNYPNPFNPSTVISYQLSVNSHVKLSIYNVLGMEVRTLVNEEKSAGSHKVKFDAKELSSGIYFYKIQAGEFVQSKKMLLAK